MNLSELKYIEFTGKHIAIAAVGVAIILMSAGLFTAFFTNLIVIVACIGGVGVAGMIAFDNYRSQKILREQPVTPARPIRPEVKPVIINLVEDSGKIPDPTTLLKYMGIDKFQEPVLNTSGYVDADSRPDLLNATINLDCLMIWGGRGAGKTNFIQHLAREKVNRGEELWIIDPKPSKLGKWPEGVNVIGQGHAYQTIMSVGEKYDFELECRKAQFQNVNDFPKVTLIVDELYLLNMKIKGFMDMILPLLLEGREYNIHMMLISQSKTARSLGLKGRYDLLECFDAIVGLDRQGWKDDPRSYSAVVDFGKGDIEHMPPGAYNPCRTNRRASHCHNGHSNNPHDRHHDRPFNDYDKRDTVTLNFEPGQRQYAQFNRLVYDSQEHKQICEMHLRGGSLNSIAKALWGASNGRRTGYIKQVLMEYNIL